MSKSCKYSQCHIGMDFGGPTRGTVSLYTEIGGRLSFFAAINHLGDSPSEPPVPQEPAVSKCAAPELIQLEEINPQIDWGSEEINVLSPSINPEFLRQILQLLTDAEIAPKPLRGEGGKR